MSRMKDLYNNEVKLKGVEFNLLDENGNVIEKLITDENINTDPFDVRSFFSMDARTNEFVLEYCENKKAEVFTPAFVILSVFYTKRIVYPLILSLTALKPASFAKR